MWRRTSLVVALLAGCGRIAFDPISDATATEVRTFLRLDRVAPGEVLIDYPLLVVLDDSRIDRSRLAADASDLRFFDASGQLIPHEIEQLGARGGPALLAWVRVPQILGIDTVISFTYGGTPVPASQTSVWSDEFAAVWHLGANGGQDSTGHFATVAFGTATTSGAIGDALAFVAANKDYMEVADSSAYLLTAGFTVTAWMKPASIPTSYYAAIAREQQNTADDDFWLGILTDQPRMECVTLPGGKQPANGSPGEIVVDQWVDLAGTVDSTIERVYANGLEVGSIALTSVVVFGNPSQPLFLGADRNGTSPPGVPEIDFLDGALDEVRLHNVARSPAWLQYDDAAMRDQVITYP